MRMIVFRIMMLLVFVLIPFMGYAQSSDDWFIAFYQPSVNDPDGTEIVIFTRHGMEPDTIQIPDLVYEQLDSYDEYASYALDLSPDRKTLVITYYVGEDVVTHEEIYILPLNDAANTRLIAVERTADFQSFGDFRPDAAQFVVGYWNSASDNGVRVVNTVDGSIVHELTLDGFNAAIPAVDRRDWFVSRNWTAEGILLLPARGDTDELEALELRLWNPTTGEITASGDYYSIYGGALLNGERLQSTQNPAFPDVDSNGANTITYFPAGAPITDPGRVIYAAPGDVPLTNPVWGANGAGFFVRSVNSAQGVIVLRDGTQIPVEVDDAPMIGSGTPDGWILVNERGAVHHYVLQGSQILVNELGNINLNDTDYTLQEVSNGGVMYLPRIGAQSFDTLFPEVMPPSN